MNTIGRLATGSFALFGMIAGLHCPVALADLPADGSSSTSTSTSTAGFAKKWDVSYFLRLNGPKIGRPAAESYNFFTLDNWPLQFYHSLSAGWALDGGRKVSAGVSGVQDLNEGVMSQYGYSIQPQFSLFNPTVSLSQDSFVDTERLNLFLTVTASIPVTEFSLARATLTTLSLDQSWLIKQPLPRLSVGLNGSVEYTVYAPSGSETALASKRLWFVSVGHFASYRLSPWLGISTSTLFDFEKQTQSAGLLQSLDRDRLKLQLNIYPGPNNLRMGVYAEGLLAGTHRTIYGFDLSAGI